MRNKRLWVYCALVLAVIGLVLIKQRRIRAERAQPIISTFTEWAARGKPVVCQTARPADVAIQTKLTVVPLTGRTVQAFVPGQTRRRLRVGQTVEVEAPGRVLTGRVIEVAREVDMETGLFAVRMVLDPGSPIPDGRRLARVRTGTIPQSICVPNAVIDQQDGQSFLWVVEDGRARRRVVVVRQRDGYGSVLSQGLRDGDQVVVRGWTQLAEGDKVLLLDVAAEEGTGR